MSSKKFLVITPLVLLFLVASGCFGGGAQFGAPGRTGIKGIVAMPDNNCYTVTCSVPQVSAGEPASQATIVLTGEEGDTLTTTSDECGLYEVSGAKDSCYVLYATIQNGGAIVKKGIYPLTTGITNDVGEANAYTTAQVILYEVIKANYPDAIKCSDIPNLVPSDNIVNAVKSTLSQCRDAQRDSTVLTLAREEASVFVGAPCVCVPVSSSANTTPTPTPTPEPQCTEEDLPLANFDYAVSASEDGWTVTFTNQSQGIENSYLWGFGDGNTSTEENPVHTYDEAGEYTVTLNVSNRCGEDEISSSLQFAVTTPTPEPQCTEEDLPLANFDYAVSASEDGWTVTFTNQSQGIENSYLWGFGDGNTSTEENPVHTYDEAGEYTVTLNVSNRCGEDEISSSLQFAVTTPTPEPTPTPSCIECTERTITKEGKYQVGWQTKSYKYTVTSKATCNNDGSITYTYTISKWSGPNISHFDIIIPNCIKKEDIISSNPRYSEFGQDGSCNISKAIKWNWGKNWGDSKTLTIKIKGQSTSNGQVLIKAGLLCLSFEGVCAPSCQ